MPGQPKFSTCDLLLDLLRPALGFIFVGANSCEAQALRPRDERLEDLGLKVNDGGRVMGVKTQLDPVAVVVTIDGVAEINWIIHFLIFRILEKRIRLPKSSAGGIM
jgi:hypothetical protein